MKLCNFFVQSIHVYAYRYPLRLYDTIFFDLFRSSNFFFFFALFFKNNKAFIVFNWFPKNKILHPKKKSNFGEKIFWRKCFWRKVCIDKSSQTILQFFLFFFYFYFCFYFLLLLLFFFAFKFCVLIFKIFIFEPMKIDFRNFLCIFIALYNI